MKQSIGILLIALSMTSTTALAQVGGLTAPKQATQSVGTNPIAINVGVDDASNQVYIIWNQPVKKVVEDKVIDGITLFINNVQRPIVNNGGALGTLSVETFVTPVGVDINPTDTVKISYTPGVNPVIGRDSGLRATPLSVTDVTDGLSADTTCPQLQTQLIKVDPTKKVFIAYMNERLSRADSAFADFSAQRPILVGTDTVTSDITITLASNIATKVLDTRPFDWSKPITITIDETTSLTDTRRNKACPGKTDLTLQPSLTGMPAIAPLTSTQNSEKVIQTAQPSTDKVTPETMDTTLPRITGITTIEPAGNYKSGTKLTVQATSSIKLDKTSTLLIELANGNKKVLLKPITDNSDTLQGTLFVTNTMISDKPLRASRIVSMKLISDTDSTKANTSTQTALLDQSSPEYQYNFGDKTIQFVAD